MGIDGNWNLVVPTPMGDHDGTLTCQVDGATLTGTMTGFGELMLDPSSTWLFSDAAVIIGGTSNHSIAIPNDSNLVGFTSTVQGYVNSVQPSGQLTNAWNLILGY